MQGLVLNIDTCSPHLVAAFHIRIRIRTRTLTPSSPCPFHDPLARKHHWAEIRGHALPFPPRQCVASAGSLRPFAHAFPPSHGASCYILTSTIEPSFASVCAWREPRRCPRAVPRPCSPWCCAGAITRCIQRALKQSTISVPRMLQLVTTLGRCNHSAHSTCPARFASAPATRRNVL